MAEQNDEVTAERQRVREHYRAELDRVAGLPAEAWKTDVRTVREAAAAHRRTAA